MGDFPAPVSLIPVLGVHSPRAGGSLIATGGYTTSATPGNAAWPSANLAIFVPFSLAVSYLVRTLWWANGSGTIAGNVDVGVYSRDGTLLFSTGATAQATNSVIQSVALGTPVLLLPGSYYLAMSASSASATFFRWATTARQGQLLGAAQQASAQPLPATFTLASFAQLRVPVFGLARATVI